MNYYETLYIIHPALDAGRVKEMVLSVNETLEKTGGSAVNIDVWGKKKLAYEIDKQKYGTYVLVQFTGDGSGNSSFNVELEHNPNVLAYLTLKIEEEKMLNQTLSLDEQISGDSPSDNTSAPDNKVSDKIEEKDSNKSDNTEEKVDDNSESEKKLDEVVEENIDSDEPTEAEDSKEESSEEEISNNDEKSEE